jgi:hypothetical protein
MGVGELAAASGETKAHQYHEYGHEAASGKAAGKSHVPVCSRFQGVGGGPIGPRRPPLFG